MAVQSFIVDRQGLLACLRGQLFSDGQLFTPAERVILSGKTRLAGGKLGMGRYLPRLSASSFQGRRASRVESSSVTNSGSKLAADIDPRIGYAKYQLDGAALARADALSLLQLMEREQVGVTGCGVDWQRVADDDGSDRASQRETYTGQVCNCSGYLESSQSGVKSVGFRSAC